MELTQIRQLPAVREIPMKSAGADSKRFFTSRMFRKQRNTVCIFRFWNRTDRKKRCSAEVDSFRVSIQSFLSPRRSERPCTCP